MFTPGADPCHSPLTSLRGSSSPVAPGFWLPGRNNVSSGTHKLSCKYKATHASDKNFSVVYSYTLNETKYSVNDKNWKEGSCRSQEVPGMCILQTFLRSSIKHMICRHHGTQSSHKSLLCRPPFCSLATAHFNI